MSQSPANTVTDRVAEVAPGDPIRADGWNVVAKLANQAMRGRWRADQGRGMVQTVTPGLDVYVRNDTGDDLPAFVPILLDETLTGIVATPDALPYESRDKPLFAGLECDGGGVNAVTQEAIPDGGIGRAVVMGVTVARVASGLSAGDTVAGPGSGNVELVAGEGLGSLVTDAVGSGDRLALVLIGTGVAATGVGTSNRCEAVRTAAANDGTEWTAGFLQDYDTGGNPKDSGEDVEVKPVNGEAFGDTSQRWLARDTGVVVGGKRRLLLERALGGSACGPLTATFTVTADRCVDGVMTTVDTDYLATLDLDACTFTIAPVEA